MVDLTIDQRLDRLEDLEEIRKLKHRYLNACDLKQPDKVLDCFAEGAIHIDYGAIGCFDNREAFVDVFVMMGCHAHVLDLHHGANDEIEIHSTQKASGRWALQYFNQNLEAKSIMLLSGIYSDSYIKCSDGKWRMDSCVFTPLTAMTGSIDDCKSTSLALGGVE